MINKGLLYTLSPLDGRYRNKLLEFGKYYSEKSLMNYRVKVEIEWLKLLISNNIVKLDNNIPISEIINNITKIDNISDDDFENIKDIESKTNHDIKAVEYFIKQKLDQLGYEAIKEYVHFGCTSEDINNLAYSLMFSNSNKYLIIPLMDSLLSNLKELSHKHKLTPMLSRTHGQPASPTTFGKEIGNFYYRLNQQLDKLKKHNFNGKFNGAVGNFNAHYFVNKEIDWLSLSQKLVDNLELNYSPMSTQIECHDSICEFLNILNLQSIIMIGFTRDLWFYNCLNYLKQIPKPGETGSSTMPHKINPIDFENAEGNLTLASGGFSTLISKLPISRMQRDLSDSTVLRNIGMYIGYFGLGIKNIDAGLKKFEINTEYMYEELSNHYEILAEPVQMYLRTIGVENPYEKLKDFTRGNKITKESLHLFIDELDISNKEKEYLKNIKPHEYIGIADKLVDNYVK